MDQIFLFAMIAMMGVLLWNSSRQRKKQAQLLAEQLEIGVEVMLGSGIYGTVESIAADRLVINSAGSTLEVARGAVARVLPKTTVEAPVSKASTAKKAATTATKQSATKTAPKKAAAKKAE